VGAVLVYSTKWVKCSAVPQATTQNTTTTHNNQHEQPPPYLSVALALSLHSNIRHRSKYGAAAPYEPVAGVGRPVHSCCCRLR
jgi:hypothetical protein